MKFKPWRRQLLLTLLFAAATTPAVHAQQTQKPTDDVIKVNTELVQTAITVVDKDGHFVDGLERENFQLLIDGKPRPINLFDRVTGGNGNEPQLTKSEPIDPKLPKTAKPSTVLGRTIIFFIDDMHMSPDSMHRTRDMLRHFLSTEMSVADTVVITTASGQIGFLEQFSNNKQVLRAAIERLSPRQYEVRSFGTGSTQMREFDALIIDTTESKKVNSEVLNYYIRECVVLSNPPKTVPIARAAIAASCETEVRNSARAVLIQTAKITQNMYASLESLMRSAARSPGRKLAFFISDGFLLNAGPHAPDLRGTLDNIIDSAQKAGVVVYSIDSRGLSNDAIDMRQGSARMDFGAPIGEMQAHQDAMNALASDTGGRALRNMNYFDRWVGKTLDEASNYYVIAWRPDNETERVAKFRQVQISVVNRPELTVRAPRGYLTGATPTNIEVTQRRPANAPRTPETDLRDALADHAPTRGLPTSLSLVFLNTPKNEMLLTSSIQVGTNALNYGDDNKQPATLRIAGVILNDKGKIAGSFKNQLKVNPIEGLSDAAGVIYNEHTTLLPGIYQVRVAARDEQSGRLGSAMQWIVIPDLAKPELTTSSILLGAQVIENDDAKNEAAQVQFSVDHTFSRSSPLGYWIFVYKAKRGDDGPSLSIQSAVVRDGRTLLSGPVKRISNNPDDVERIPFSDELSLQSLAPGRYELTVTVKDEIAGTTATQQIDFQVR
jgi:VWFA-related protein